MLKRGLAAGRSHDAFFRWALVCQQPSAGRWSGLSSCLRLGLASMRASRTKVPPGNSARDGENTYEGFPRQMKSLRCHRSPATVSRPPRPRSKSQYSFRDKATANVPGNLEVKFRLGSRKSYHSRSPTTKYEGNVLLNGFADRAAGELGPTRHAAPHVTLRYSSTLPIPVGHQAVMHDTKRARIFTRQLHETHSKIQPRMNAAQQIATDTSDPSNSVTSPDELQYQAEHSNKSPLTLGDDVRRTLRALTYPVVVVTAGHATSAVPQRDGTNELLGSSGVTISSFCTVTLHPDPIITFNLKLPSRTWDAISTTRQMNVHLLQANSESAAIADLFTKPYERGYEPFVSLVRDGTRVTRFRDLAPEIHGSRAIMARITAQLQPQHCAEVGDHVIVVAKVLACHHSRDTASSEGLAYAKQGYRGMGPNVDRSSSMHVPIPEIDRQEPLPRQATNSTLTERQDEHFLKPRSTGAWGLSSMRTFSTRARAVSLRGIQYHSVRVYSSDKPTRALDDIVEPSARAMNVADFLGFPDDNVPWRMNRVRHILRRVRDIESARERLSSVLDLTPDNIASCERFIKHNENAIARNVGLNAAKELRTMLDKGRVDAKRAPWLEGSVEKAQAVMLQHAQTAKDEYQKGKLSPSAFASIRESLKRQYDLLSTEVMRLRQMVDEEAEGPYDDF